MSDPQFYLKPSSLSLNRYHTSNQSENTPMEMCETKLEKEGKNLQWSGDQVVRKVRVQDFENGIGKS